ncbi:MAG: DMT family transporter [Burkholderiales bacterium]|nr:DMT family transporter [Burkholderiales bacterium]
MTTSPPSPPNPSSLSQFSRREIIILILLTLCWGLNWPMMKIGVQHFPPLTFRCLSMLGGLVVLWIAGKMAKQDMRLSRANALPMLRLAMPNMVIWHVFIILGVAKLSSGRAAILGYTMPLWAVLFGLLLYREKVSPRAWFGLACAFSGTLLLLSNEFARLAGQAWGTIFALIAAAGWGYGTVQLKRATLSMPTIALTFWMLVCANICLLIGAIALEQAAWRLPLPAEWMAIIYNAVLVFGFAHLAWFRLARSLPPVASSLSIMLIPMVGLFSGAWLLAETPHWQDYAALLLMLLAMACVLLPKKKS